MEKKSDHKNVEIVLEVLGFTAPARTPKFIGV